MYIASSTINIPLAIPILSELNNEDISDYCVSSTVNLNLYQYTLNLNPQDAVCIHNPFNTIPFVQIYEIEITPKNSNDVQNLLDLEHDTIISKHFTSEFQTKQYADICWVEFTFDQPYSIYQYHLKPRRLGYNDLNFIALQAFNENANKWITLHKLTSEFIQRYDSNDQFNEFLEGSYFCLPLLFSSRRFRLLFKGYVDLEDVQLLWCSSGYNEKYIESTLAYDITLEDESICIRNIVQKQSLLKVNILGA